MVKKSSTSSTPLKKKKFKKTPSAPDISLSSLPWENAGSSSLSLGKTPSLLKIDKSRSTSSSALTTTPTPPPSSPSSSSSSSIGSNGGARYQKKLAVVGGDTAVASIVRVGKERRGSDPVQASDGRKVVSMVSLNQEVVDGRRKVVKLCLELKRVVDKEGPVIYSGEWFRTHLFAALYDAAEGSQHKDGKHEG
ncbi:hypothetical protein HK104_000566 [Borealophlyctis nickersoniae]|nr:hypothetical protein HK104_000566 [Borealophlyctis nickersoniae]